MAKPAAKKVPNRRTAPPDQAGQVIQPGRLLPDTENAQLIACMGARGNGKSAWAKLAIEEVRPTRLVVWDMAREDRPYPFVGKPETDIRVVLAAMKLPKFHLCFYPSGNKKRRDMEFDLFCRALMLTSSKAAPVWGVVEELAFVTLPSWSPGSWQEVSLLGRHRGLNIIGTSQRPASIDKDFLGNATLVHSARLGYEDDAKVVSKALRCTPMDLLNLPPLHYLERCENDEVTKKGALPWAKQVSP